MQKDRKGNDRFALPIRSGIKAGKGLGDMVADFTHLTGIDRLAQTYTECTGKDCGCEERRTWMNQIFPG